MSFFKEAVTEKKVLKFVYNWFQEEAGKDNLPVFTLNPDTMLMKEGIFDSMKLITLVTSLEEEYGIEIGVDLMLPANFESPKAIARMVTNLCIQSE